MTDPDGVAARRTEYDRWQSQNIGSLEQIDRYNREITPRLYPTQKGQNVDALEYTRARAIGGLRRDLSAMTPEQVSALCLHFAMPGSLEDEKFAPFLVESFDYLEKWQSRHPNP